MSTCSCGMEMDELGNGFTQYCHDDYPCEEKNCPECERYNKGQARKRAGS